MGKSAAVARRIKKRSKASATLAMSDAVLASLAPDKIVEARARPAALARSGSVLPSLRLDNQFSRIGGSVTPLQLSAIIREADSGENYRLIDLMNESRQKDCHLQSLLGTREAALCGLRWTMVPASREEEDMKRARVTELALKGAAGNPAEPQDSRGFADVIGHLAGGAYYGYAVSETEWAMKELEGAGLMAPLGFRNHSARRFKFSDKSGKLGWYDTGAPIGAEPIEVQKRWPQKFLQHQPRINGDIPAREGLGRVLVWAAIFRNWSISDWLRLAELAWKPWRIGKFSPDASNEEIDGLTAALDLLTTQGVGVFSDRADISVEWPLRGRGGKPEHESLADWLGSEMSKGVLGQTLTVEAGERGARSLGEVHDRVRKDIREIDAITCAVTINRDLVVPMNTMNYGTSRPPPVFMFVTDDAIDRGAFGRFLDACVRAGLKIPMKWARDKAGIPEPQTDDELLMGRSFMEAEAGLILSNVLQFGGQEFGQKEEPANDDDAAAEEDEDDAA